MKAIILAAGRGKRLKEATEPANKCMLMFNDRHLIEYSLESARLCDVDKIIIVVGFRAEDIINTFGINYQNIRVQYVIQENQTGLVDAIELCCDAVNGDDFILFLADEVLIDPQPMVMINKFKEDDLFVMCGVTRVKDRTQIRKTYSIIFNQDDDTVYRLIEKPRNPINDVMGTGNCIFKNGIFDYIQYTPISYVRNEKELPDLIQCAIDDGAPVKLFFIGTQYININTPDDVVMAKNIFKKE